jgi:hypothetical protein
MEINKKIMFQLNNRHRQINKEGINKTTSKKDCHSFFAITLRILMTRLFLCLFPAHPNIKLFITQCGLQSFQEAVYHGVPMLGIPFFADQKYNAKKIATEEIGLQLSFHEITKDTLLTTIKEIFNNSK